MDGDESQSPSRLPMPASSQVPKPGAYKRRSLLMPRGTISGAAKKGVLSPTDEEPPKSRPVTTFGDAQGLAALRRRLEEEEAGETMQSKEEARASAHAQLTGGDSRIGGVLPAPKTGIARSNSMRAPATSRHGQSRIGARPLSMVKEKARSRPESSSSSASRSSPSDGPAPRLKAPSTAANAGNGLRRAATTTSRHGRTQSALPPAPSNTGLPRLDVRRHPTISEGLDARSATSLHRPAFSTLQQHYSPKKNTAPKPASMTLINSQPTETASSLGLETQLLQTRLLQLSILHRQAEPTYQAWCISAKRKLKHKFTDVAAECEVVRQKEKETRKRLNTVALKEWCKGDMGLLAENIKILSEVVNEVMQLVEEGGRVQQCIDIFEAWVTWVEAVYRGRERHHESKEFIEGLGDGWKGEVAGLLRRMGSLGRVLDGLDRGVVGKASGSIEGGGSSLYEIVTGFNTLVKSVAEELRAVEMVEEEVVRCERRWVDEQVGALEGDIDALLA